jgi:hypothetical protein
MSSMEKFLKISLPAVGMLLVALAVACITRTELLIELFEDTGLDPAQTLGVLLLIATTPALLALLCTPFHPLVRSSILATWFLTVCYSAALVGKADFLYELSDVNAQIIALSFLFCGCSLILFGSSVGDFKKRAHT